MEYANENFVWPLEKYPSGRFKQLHETCMYPNGRLDGKLIACDNPAGSKVGRYWFCQLHTPMVERGCLDMVYSDGTTVREQMLRVDKTVSRSRQNATNAERPARQRLACGSSL